MPKRKNRLGAGDLILNTPFVEPERYWSYDRQYMIFTQIEGRRPAGYVVATPNVQGFNDPGQFVELELVNQIRPRVKEWREANYPGATGITRRLLEHWYDPDQREGMRFFFCQLEAIETLIWLTEATEADKQGIDIPSDGGPFPRLCAKMATGSGKTIVMAMVIAWQTLNRVTYSQDSRYSKHILAIAPGLTVRNRLAVLVPDSPGNYFDLFQIVPPALYDKLRQAKVVIHNWHKLGWDTDEQIAKRRSVDKRGAKSDEAYTREVLGEMAAARNLIVLNDEAHHAWRVPAGSSVQGVSKDDLDSATKWIEGLDRIHRSRNLVHCFDFSATPYTPSGKKSSEDALFGWITSDFGLNDAIESGLVKTPRVVVRDNGKLDAEYKSRFYHLYRDDDVQDDFNRKALPHEPLPDIVTQAYTLLGQDWLETRKDWESVGHPVPPVLITVANRTETAARIKYAFDHEKILITELCDPDRTLHIDSSVLKKAESQDQATELTRPPSDDDDDGTAKPLTKQQQAELLRLQVDTVGQVGRPGEQLQNVISVGMLSEGWDAKTVTHVMGLRAFSSQLLCEQVVGRGLRRTSYDINPETGQFEPEYVNIFGVPFTFLPHEEGDDTPPPPPKPKTLVEPIREREQEFGITWPNVIRIEHEYSPELHLEIANVPALELNPRDTPTHAELAAILEGKPNMDALSEIDLRKLGERHRLQTVVFKMARDVFEQMQPSWNGTRESLLSQVISIVDRVLRSDRVRANSESYNEDPLKRRILLILNMNRIVQHIWEAIRFENTMRLTPVFDSHRPLLSTSDMRPWFTSRPCEVTKRSHINVAVYDSTWEGSEAFELDHSELVNSWVKNDHLGFEILYVYRGVVRKYRPDFLVRLECGTMLIIETKGQETDESKAKHLFLDQWVKAINQSQSFGFWAWTLVNDSAKIGWHLDEFAVPNQISSW
ncbi:BPTD_3080 family restriction endonuclease [Rubripirellula reticaptiva]|uniref:Type III restriction enzyme, res subunit n=1 Tax=Rubripirellula reticaptiva TaxID=2528013 RepID=A0A5C6EGY4_9BACT|nr:DEAD/DEAH box helicase family protein [Rubripirellula reticaptiva]TWU46499.1 Type III restriction enzyme, res subunit [Rubripirellula reticaptiva]